jgi:Amt family ammonium transporter
MAMNGVLSGLVAITGGCAVMEPWAAVVTGIIAGWLYIYGSNLLIRLRIDDAVDAIPVHMLNGMWGLLATGLVASPRKLELAYGDSDHTGWFYSLGAGSFDASLLTNQVMELLFILGWTFFTMFPFFIWLNYQGWLRADSLEELVGLDMSYHGGMNVTSSSQGVKKEYVAAYNRHKSTIRQRRAKPPTTILSQDRCQPSSGDTVPSINEDPEMNQEAAAEEAMLE